MGLYLSGQELELNIMKKEDGGLIPSLSTVPRCVSAAWRYDRWSPALVLHWMRT